MDTLTHFGGWGATQSTTNPTDVVDDDPLRPKMSKVTCDVRPMAPGKVVSLCYSNNGGLLAAAWDNGEFIVYDV